MFLIIGFHVMLMSDLTDDFGIASTSAKIKLLMYYHHGLSDFTSSMKEKFNEDEVWGDLGNGNQALEDGSRKCSELLYCNQGPPEGFALQTVQEVIKPQKGTKLVQDENQLLENILRTLLQELVSSAVQSGEQIMQYGQSIDDGEATRGHIPRLLGLRCVVPCEKEHVEGGMIFQLLEDLTEMSTMRNCKDVFGYIESKQDILGKQELFARGKLVMLRTCNQLLRRLSKANDVVFCGRILMFLAHFFPLSERSAVNIKGVF
ncbi:hypothetical protein M0R45_036457 [Rubus argutus]|uniref:Uncharacterized protein n=1 Tax=Rubus argutus TaxID=59490 RepID=A0AAW1VX67_RUBAR